MKARLTVAAICIPLLLVILYALPPIGATLLIAGMSALAAYELLHTTGLMTSRGVLFCCVVVAGLIPLLCYAGMLGPLTGTQALSIGLGLVFVLFLILQGSLLAGHTKVPFQMLTVGLYGAVLIPLFLSSLVRILLGEDGKYYVVVPFIIAFVADGAALFAGMLFGRHKLAPIISPKKTVEGVVGGVVGAMLAMGIYCLVIWLGFDRQPSLGLSLLYAVLGSGTSVMGDLSFSVIKRQTGIKDYGTLLPGHGGVLDRFDSMVFTAPLIELLIYLLPLYR